MRKRITILCVLTLAFLSFSTFAYAHDRDEHDNDIKLILFGNESFNPLNIEKENRMHALEDATYLALDQFNGYGQDALDFLNNLSIPNLPKSVSTIDFKSNYYHRWYTHRGWSAVYPDDSHWSVRKDILYNTVEYVLFTKHNTGIDWFPGLSDFIFGKYGNSKQIESFCILLYNIHIIGDHIEATQYKNVDSVVSPLVRRNDSENPGVIPEIKRCIQVLFEKQKGTRSYQALMQELDDLINQCEELMKNGGISDIVKNGEVESEFQRYHQCAIDLRNVLGEYVPFLLNNEDFFHDAFYN